MCAYKVATFSASFQTPQIQHYINVSFISISRLNNEILKPEAYCTKVSSVLYQQI